MNEDEEQGFSLSSVSSLESINVFEEFDKDVLLDLASRIKPLTLKEGEVLFCEGDEAEAMYIVIEGCLQAVITSGMNRKVVVHEMGEGVPVGEIALLLGGKRNATVFAIANSKIAELTREDFEEIMAKYPKIRQQLLNVVLNRLRRSLLAKVLPEYFGEMDESIFNYVESQFEWVHIKRGEALFKKGDKADSLFILINGLLHVVDEGRTESERLVGVIPWGEIVGEMAVLSDERRTASIYSARDSDLVRLSKPSFDKICDKYPLILMAITRTLILRLKYKGKRWAQKNTAMSIAVVPAGPDVPLIDFTNKLCRALGENTSTVLLTQQEIDRQFNKKGIAQTPENDPRTPGINAWLTEIETLHSYVVYRAEYDTSPWTRRCLSRADKVLLVAEADSDPSPGIIETKLLSRFDRSHYSGKILVLLHKEDTVIPRGTSKWLNSRQLQTHFHICRNRDDDYRRLARILSNRAIGLALGGGSAKGIAHIGVIRALEEAGIPIDMIGGTSMGAIIGAKYAMGSNFDDMMSMAYQLFREINPFNEYTLPIISLLRSRKIEHMSKLAYSDIEIEDLWLNYFCLASNLTTSELKIFRRGPLWKAVRASSALPGVIAPVIEDGEVYVDGGVINNLPGDIMRQQCGVVIVVEVNPNLNLSFQIDSIPSPWKVFWSRIFPFRNSIKTPTILDIIMSSILTGSYMAANNVKQDADLILIPPVARIGFLDFKNMEQAAEIGYRYTMEMLEKLDDETRKKLIVK